METLTRFSPVYYTGVLNTTSRSQGYVLGAMSGRGEGRRNPQVESGISSLGLPALPAVMSFRGLPRHCDRIVKWVGRPAADKRWAETSGPETAVITHQKVTWPVVEVCILFACKGRVQFSVCEVMYFFLCINVYIVKRMGISVASYIYRSI